MRLLRLLQSGWIGWRGFRVGVPVCGLFLVWFSVFYLLVVFSFLVLLLCVVLKLLSFSLCWLGDVCVGPLGQLFRGSGLLQVFVLVRKGGLAALVVRLPPG